MKERVEKALTGAHCETEHFVSPVGCLRCEEEMSSLIKELWEELSRWRDSHHTEGSEYNPDYCAARDALKEYIEAHSATFAENQALRIQVNALKTLRKSYEESEPSYRRSYHAAQKELEALKPKADSVDSERAMNAELTAENQRLEARERKLEEALKFYADDASWHIPQTANICDLTEFPLSSVDWDSGKIAKQALSGESNE